MHRAPKGALRLSDHRRHMRTVARQKAPSAKRCIKTRQDDTIKVQQASVGKHRAPKGALRLPYQSFNGLRLHLSESTERQKVH